MSQTGSAFSLVISSVGWLWRTPTLRKWTFLSAAVTFLLWLLLWVVFWTHSFGWLQNLWAQPESFWGKGLWYLAWIFGFWLWTSVSVLLLPAVILAVVQDPLSEATEVAMRVVSPKTTSLGKWVGVFLRSFGWGILRVVLWGLGQGLLLVLLLLPGLGAALFATGSVLWGSFWLGADFIGAVMMRHGYRLREVLSLLFQNLGSLWGLGVPLYFTLGIPLLNLLTFPVAVVAATRVFHQLKAQGHMPAQESSP